MDKEGALAAIDRAHRAILETFKPMPDAALTYLPPGDDYALGGIVVHLIGSLDGYIKTLEALRAAGFEDTTGPAEDGAVVDAQLARARAGLAPNERDSTFAQLHAKHERLARVAAAIPDEAFGRVVAVQYPGDDTQYPTSPALILQWMTEHYQEHVPHARDLYARYSAQR